MKYHLEETFFWRKFYANDELIEQHFITKIFLDWCRIKIVAVKMTLKCKVAFWLLKGVGDPCPHCNKTIDIGNWSKFE